MLPPVRDVRTQPADVGRRLHRQLEGDEDVVEVDRGGGTDAVVRGGGQGVRVVERGPVVLRGELGRGVLPGAQGRILVEEPGADVLAVEVHGVGVLDGFGEAGGLFTDAGRRPGRRGVRAVDRLVDDGVERGVGEADLVGDVEEEGGAQPLLATDRVEGVLEEVVQGVEAAGATEVHADHAEAAGGEPGTVGEELLVGVEVPADVPDELRRPGELRVEAVIAHRGLRVGGAVDVVDRDQTGQTTGEEGLGHTLGVLREVGGDAEAAEGLAEQRPRLLLEGLAEQLGVRHYAVGAQVGEVLGREGDGGIHRGGPAGAALVEQDDPVVLQGLAEPAADLAGGGGGTQCAVTGPALEEEEGGQVLAAEGDVLTGEDVDGAVVGRVAVDEWCGEHVFCHGVAVAAGRGRGEVHDLGSTSPPVDLTACGWAAIVKVERGSLADADTAVRGFCHARTSCSSRA